MADPQTNPPEPQARQSRPDGAAGRPPAEARAFDKATDSSRRAVDAGADAARDIAQVGTQAGAEAGRHLAEAGRNLAEAGQDQGRRLAESGRRGADLWRESMTPFFALSAEMNRWFDAAWRQGLVGVAAPGLSPMNAPGSAMLQGLMGLPSADLRETPEAYHITVELAGLRPEEVELTLDGDNLVVSGERRDEHRDPKAYRITERRFGRFERRFALPRDAERQGVKAEFDNGLLRITAPRRPEDAPGGRRRIEVTPAQPSPRT
jgi:HSP20 family protein